MRQIRTSVCSFLAVFSLFLPSLKQHTDVWWSEWKSRLDHLVFPGPIATGELESLQVLDRQ